ncbi:hypothetical protein WR25_03686 [Diploscapter pachys]|uniref:60S ribosomal export protein NMD3 n=1 Tax=Diploscapter pachys TaxID=2018661 RepID=A0A2A2LP27_9BILA|nr:hypothetical protein WR25_03686 [Diploscapter pachys]
MQPMKMEPSVARVACCECGIAIEPNGANMCAACLRSRIDITEGISRTCIIYLCKFCDRYFVPPSAWVRAEPESKELLSICLKKLKPSLAKVRLTDASFVWTEAHSKRLKVKLTVQKEVFSNVVLQQSLVIEFTVHNQMCDDCRRAEAKDFWRACVQVRQKAEFKKTLFYLEQLLLKHKAHKDCTGVKPVPTGIDFYFPKLQDARKFVDFLVTVLPCKYQYAQELVSHDTKNNTYDYKHTFCVDIVPICRDNVVCLPKKVAQALGNMSQIVVCQRVSNVISLIDPNNLQLADIQGCNFWRDPFETLCGPKQLTEFYVMDVELVQNFQRNAGHGLISKKHELADVWLQRSDQVGAADAEQFSTRTHLGHLLNPGDLVLGFDVKNCNVNNRIFDDMKADNIPDVVIVKKVYDRSRRAAKRQWKLKRLVVGGNIAGNETDSVADEFQRFIEDVEEDPVMREHINIYKDSEKVVGDAKTEEQDMEDGEGEVPGAPTVEEMLDDLHFDSDSDEGAESNDGTKQDDAMEE